jgi:hypothetical protein
MKTQVITCRFRSSSSRFENFNSFVFGVDSVNYNKNVETYHERNSMSGHRERGRDIRRAKRDECPRRVSVRTYYFSNGMSRSYPSHVREYFRQNVGHSFAGLRPSWTRTRFGCSFSRKQQNVRHAHNSRWSFFSALAWSFFCTTFLHTKPKQNRPHKTPQTPATELFLRKRLHGVLVRDGMCLCVCVCWRCVTLTSQSSVERRVMG